MPFGLTNDVVAQCQQVFKQFPEITSVIIYGSRVKGNYRPASDIDLTLKGQALSHDLLLQVEMALDDLFLPYKIDLSIYHQLDNPELKEHIDRVGEIFYSIKSS